MLVLRRNDGQWVEIQHRSGDLLRIRVFNCVGRFPGRVDMAFDDAAHNFLIERPERYAGRGPGDRYAGRESDERCARGFPNGGPVRRATECGQ